MTTDQAKIIAWARSVGGQFTKREAVAKFDHYYHNGGKYVGERLSRMVDAGLLERVSPGRYKVGKGKKSNPATIDTNQTDLFK